MSGLIEGLPDAVALQCLARVPFCDQPNLQLVCRSWRDAIRSPDLFKIRHEIGVSDEILCVSAYEPENVWQLYNPVKGLWMTLPKLPSQIRHLSHFGVVSTAGKLFVLGGGSDVVDPVTGDNDGIFATDEVWSYDPIRWCWTRKASMLAPRAMFACCVLNGKVIVAGGFSNYQKSSKAEIYDPEKDVWVAIEDLHLTHNSACAGLVIGGKVHVLHKGLSTVHVLDITQLQWTLDDYLWLQGPMALVRKDLYVLNNDMIYKEDIEQGKRSFVALASCLQNRVGFAMIGLGDELYIIGGVIMPGRNADIKPLSDVDVLNVRSETPTWCSMTPMMLCRGTVLGCTVLKIQVPKSHKDCHFVVERHLCCVI